MASSTDAGEGEHIDLQGRPAVVLTRNQYRNWVLARITTRLVTVIFGVATAIAGVLGFLGYYFIQNEIETQVSISSNTVNEQLNNEISALREQIRTEAAALREEVQSETSRAIRTELTYDETFQTQIERLIDDIFANPAARDRLLVGIANEFENEFANVIALRTLRSFVQSAFEPPTDTVVSERRRNLEQFTQFDETDGRRLLQYLDWRPRPTGAAPDCAETFDHRNQASEETQLTAADNDQSARTSNGAEACRVFIADESEEFVQMILESIDMGEGDAAFISALTIQAIFDRITRAEPGMEIDTYSGFAADLPDGELVGVVGDWVVANADDVNATKVASGLARGGQRTTAILLAEWLETEGNATLANTAWRALAQFDVSGLTASAPAARTNLARSALTATLDPEFLQVEPAAVIFGDELFRIVTAADASPELMLQQVRQLCAPHTDDETTVAGVVCSEIEFDSWYFEDFSTEFFNGAELCAAAVDFSGLPASQCEPAIFVEPLLAVLLPGDWFSLVQAEFLDSLNLAITQNDAAAADRAALLLNAWTQRVRSDAPASHRDAINAAADAVLTGENADRQLDLLLNPALSSFEFFVRHASEERAGALTAATLARVRAGGAIDPQSAARLVTRVRERMTQDRDPRYLVQALQLGHQQGEETGSELGRKATLEILAAGLAGRSTESQSGGLAEILTAIVDIADSGSREPFQLAVLDLIDFALTIPTDEELSDNTTVAAAAQSNIHFVLDRLSQSENEALSDRALELSSAFERVAPWRAVPSDAAPACETAALTGAAEQWCTFAISNEGPLVLDVTGAPINYVIALDKDGRTVSASACSSEACSITLNVADQSGELRVLVSSAGDSSQIVTVATRNTLTLSAPADRGTGAVPELAAGTYNFETPSDEFGVPGAWFALPTSSVDTTYLITTTGLTAGVDTYLSVVRSDDQVIQDDDGGPGLASFIRVTINANEQAELFVENIADAGEFTVIIDVE